MYKIVQKVNTKNKNSHNENDITIVWFGNLIEFYIFTCILFIFYGQNNIVIQLKNIFINIYLYFVGLQKRH